MNNCLAVLEDVDEVTKDEEESEDASEEATIILQEYLEQGPEIQKGLEESESLLSKVLMKRI